MVVLFEDYRSKRECLRLTLQTYRGVARIDLRLWYLASDGAYKPGRHGFTVPRHAVTALTDALGKAADLAETDIEPAPLT